MNTTEHERDDHAFPQQCRTCGGGIDERDESVFEESEDDAAYMHETCAA